MTNFSNFWPWSQTTTPAGSAAEKGEKQTGDATKDTPRKHVDWLNAYPEGTSLSMPRPLEVCNVRPLCKFTAITITQVDGRKYQTWLLFSHTKDVATTLAPKSLPTHQDREQVRFVTLGCAWPNAQHPCSVHWTPMPCSETPCIERPCGALIPRRAYQWRGTVICDGGGVSGATRVLPGVDGRGTGPAIVLWWIIIISKIKYDWYWNKIVN